MPPLKSANWSLEHLPGLSEADRTTLHALGIKSTFHLLRQAWTSSGKEDLSARSGIHIQHIQKWVALCDLARVPSVGCDYCGVLLHSGIATLEQLARTPAGPLHRQIMKLQVALFRNRDRCPNAGQINLWTQQANTLIQHEKR
jgi:Domain of unknown function (DUF4332)